jgi:hypothetical protein
MTEARVAKIAAVGILAVVAIAFAVFMGVRNAEADRRLDEAQRLGITFEE